jgi:phosphocarrier protein
VFVEKGGQEVNGKSIMGLLMLVASKGSVLTIRAAGDRSEEAVAELIALIEAYVDTEGG